MKFCFFTNAIAGIILLWVQTTITLKPDFSHNLSTVVPGFHTAIDADIYEFFNPWFYRGTSGILGILLLISAFIIGKKDLKMVKHFAVSLATSAVIFLLSSYLFQVGPYEQGYTVYPPLSGLGNTDWEAPMREARIKSISVGVFSLIIGVVTYVLLSRKKTEVIE